jgi:hypothetical protein
MTRGNRRLVRHHFDQPRRLVPVGVLLGLVGCGQAAARHLDRNQSPGAMAGHSRPRSVAVDARGDLLYVALSTTDQIAVVDVTGGRARHVVDMRVCAFPDGLAALPGGGVIVACRFDPGLRLLRRIEADATRPRFDVRVIDAGPAHGHRGIAIDPVGRFAYVASPPTGGVKIVDLGDHPRPIRLVATGLFPQVVRFVRMQFAQSDSGTATQRPLLMVSNLVGHTVTIHDVQPDGGLSKAIQTISTEAPVLDFALIPQRGDDSGATDSLRGALVLLTHEDRPLSRQNLSVEGLDSVLLRLDAAVPGAMAPFVDRGPGKRLAINLTERAHDPLVGLDAVAVEPTTGRLAIVGAGTDNLLVAEPRAGALRSAATVTVGANPSAVAFLSDGRTVTADRLSDTVSLVAATDATVPGAAAASAGRVQTLTLGSPERQAPAERGELLFYGRALVPNNVADGPLSVYTCAACHVDGHVDGRRHPSKRNRFFSMTKTCRGLKGTEPFLSLGKPDTFAAFADNIVATHAQGALEAPDTYDRYPVRLRLRSAARWTEATLSPREVRTDLAAYLERIPVEPSPFVEPGRHRLTASERRGLEIFRASCSGCHQLAVSTNRTQIMSQGQIESGLLAGQLALTSLRLYDVGTPVLGEGGNNPPSLRGVWAAAPYFSDGSATNLEAVLDRTRPDSKQVHGAQNARLPGGFSVGEQADLLVFLRAL